MMDENEETFSTTDDLAVEQATRSAPETEGPKTPRVIRYDGNEVLEIWGIGTPVTHGMVIGPGPKGDSTPDLIAHCLAQYPGFVILE